MQFAICVFCSRSVGVVITVQSFVNLVNYSSKFFKIIILPSHFSPCHMDPCLLFFMTNRILLEGYFNTICRRDMLETFMFKFRFDLDFIAVYERAKKCNTTHLYYFTLYHFCRFTVTMYNYNVQYVNLSFSYFLIYFTFYECSRVLGKQWNWYHLIATKYTIYCSESCNAECSYYISPTIGNAFKNVRAVHYAYVDDALK